MSQINKLCIREHVLLTGLGTESSWQKNHKSYVVGQHPYLCGASHAWLSLANEYMDKNLLIKYAPDTSASGKGRQ